MSARCNMACVSSPFAFAAIAGAILGIAPPRADAAVEWADWITGTHNFPSSFSLGAFPVSNISINYGGSTLIRQTGSGTDYWSPSSPYTSPSVPNPPPPAHMLGVVDFAASHTVSWGTPISGVVMAIVGLGSASTPTQWVFDTPFTILSSGQGYFGGAGTLTALPGNTLQGDEGSGVILFPGAISGVSWTIVNGEQPWHEEAHINGFTLGIIPAPPAAALLALAALAVPRRRR